MKTIGIIFLYFLFLLSSCKLKNKEEVAISPRPVHDTTMTSTGYLLTGHALDSVNKNSRLSNEPLIYLIEVDLKNHTRTWYCRENGFESSYVVWYY
ncbi:MAG: hypothetical protein Q8L01_02985 [Candidatus Woesebacteria bacterium]|nr:hypothetical protein [Candidatus Woesebacteria bacterium]